jgi:hypothetical protein
MWRFSTAWSWIVWLTWFQARGTEASEIYPFVYSLSEVREWSLLSSPPRGAVTCQIWYAIISYNANFYDTICHHFLMHVPLSPRIPFIFVGRTGLAYTKRCTSGSSVFAWAFRPPSLRWTANPMMCLSRSTMMIVCIWWYDGWRLDPI